MLRTKSWIGLLAWSVFLHLRSIFCLKKELFPQNENLKTSHLIGCKNIFDKEGHKISRFLTWTIAHVKARETKKMNPRIYSGPRLIRIGTLKALPSHYVVFCFVETKRFFFGFQFEFNRVQFPVSIFHTIVDKLECQKLVWLGIL